MHAESESYASFEAFMRYFVLPRRRRHPDDARLDGWASGSNNAIAAEFTHRGVRWKVHADTRYAPLEIAYGELQRDAVSDPFEIEWTARRTRRCLVLRPDLRRRYDAPYKHLFVYDR